MRKDQAQEAVANWAHHLQGDRDEGAQEDVAFAFSGSILHPPDTIAAIVDKITEGGVCRQWNDERRSAARYSVVTTVEAQSLDGEYKPAGEPFRAVTRDLSTTGIGITHNHSIDSKYIGIQLTSPEGLKLQTVVEITRSVPTGKMWDIGGRFVTDTNVG